VMGQVNKPGPAAVPPGATLLQALAVGGGFTNFAATRRIELLRQDSSGDEQAYSYNYDAMISGARTRAVVLRPGDVIVVPQRRLFE
jgi:polysaccharide biosynthesis/export protein